MDVIYDINSKGQPLTKAQVRKEGKALQATLEKAIQKADPIHIPEILRYVRWLDKQLPQLIK
tara:strand:- start:502 stop:687 length:186 start_codon:yes stop_codon:yes gene_type:complete